MIQTRSQTKASGVKLPEVHGTRKRLDPHKILKKQLQPVVKPVTEKNLGWVKEEQELKEK